MKNVDSSRCRSHTLICTNQRSDGRTACHDFGGQAFFMKVKDRLKQTGKLSTHWATRTGCLGFCNSVGTTVVIHRPGEEPQWMTEVTDEDFDSVWDQIVRDR
jgi:(2Fe-2S) ferredoxin